MLICDYCHNAVSEGDAEESALRCKRSSGRYKCPRCGGEEFSDAVYCRICGEWKDPLQMASEHCCNDCADDRLTVKDGLRYIDTDRQMQAEFYIEYQFDSTVQAYSTALIALCKESFGMVVEICPDKALEDIRNYLKDNLEYWAEWAVQNTKRGA